MTFSAFTFDHTEFLALLTSSLHLPLDVLRGFLRARGCQKPQVLVALYAIHIFRFPTFGKFVPSLLNIFFS